MRTETIKGRVTHKNYVYSYITVDTKNNNVDLRFKDIYLDDGKYSQAFFNYILGKNVIVTIKHKFLGLIKNISIQEVK